MNFDDLVLWIGRISLGLLFVAFIMWLWEDENR